MNVVERHPRGFGHGRCRDDDADGERTLDRLRRHRGSAATFDVVGGDDRGHGGEWGFLCSECLDQVPTRRSWIGVRAAGRQQGISRAGNSAECLRQAPRGHMEVDGGVHFFVLLMISSRFINAE